MPKHNEPQYKTKANAKGVIYAYTRVDGRQVALGRAGEAAWDKYLSVLDEWRAHAAERAYHEGGRAIVSAESLTQGDKVAWLYTTPELVDALRKPGRPSPMPSQRNGSTWTENRTQDGS